MNFNSGKSAYWKLYKQHSKIEACFAFGSDCSSKISASHSLQKIGILNQLEDDRIGGKKIYSLEEWITDSEDKEIVDFKLVGKKTASIFNGFCDKHDVELFAPIEQQPIEFSDYQLFLFYYRGFAHSYHNVAEQTKFFKYILDNFRNSISSEAFEHFLTKYAVFSDINKCDEAGKRLLNEMIKRKNFSLLRHHYRVVPYKRIACSQRIIPAFTYSNISLKRWESISQVILTVIPDHDRTIILFSWFHDDKKGNHFMSEITTLSDNEFTHAVSSTILHAGMNTYFAPEFWNSFNETKKKLFIKELNYLIHKGATHGKFFMSEVDIFK